MNHSAQRILISSVLILWQIPGILRAQEGDPFMTHIRIEEVPDRKLSAITEDKEHSLVFAGNTGVITYDSEEWKIWPVPNIPLTLSPDSLFPMIYVGGRGFYGYLLKTPAGAYEYHALNEESEHPGDIRRIHQTRDFIIFYGETMIAVCNRTQLFNITRYHADSIHVFSGMFVHRNQAYINLLGKGIHRMEHGNYLPFPNDVRFGDTEILFGEKCENGSTLLGTDDNRLFLFNGSSFQSLSLEDQAYLNESYLEDAVLIGETRFAFSTILGGCLIADISNGETRHIINVQNGLPDDEIYALARDANKGVWLSHQYGLTRVDTRLPMRSYGTYPGLKGNVTAVALLDTVIYVATNEGVYFLEEKKEMKEEEVVVPVREKVRVEPPPSPSPQAEPADTSSVLPEEAELSARERRKLKRDARRAARKARKESADTIAGTVAEPAAESPADTAEAEKERRGIFSIFQRKEAKPEAEAETEAETEAEAGTTQAAIPTTVSRIRYIKQKIYSLQSISHEFTRVGAFNEKAKDLLPVGNRILVPTNEGLYEIVENTMRMIAGEWYVESLYPSDDPDRVFVVTDQSSYLLELNEGAWVVVHDFDFINEDIYSFCEDAEGSIWVGCDSKCYKLGLQEERVVSIEPHVFKAEYYDPVILWHNRDTVHLLRSTGLYFFDGDSIRSSGRLRGQKITRILRSAGDIAWIHADGTWLGLTEQSNYDPAAERFLHPLDEIEDLFLDERGNIWAVHGDNFIHMIDRSALNAYQPVFSLFLKAVYDEEQAYDLSALQFSYHDHGIVFNFSAPFYLKENSTSYQYYVEGISNDWSDWERSGSIRFPVLPMGRFILKVRAVNALKQVSNVQDYPIVIKPPWWLSWWFLSMVALSIILVVFFLIRWRLARLRKEKAVLEQKVAERTEEIRMQRDEIAEQKKEIMDSIYYARRIQQAILPSQRKLRQSLPEHFILYLPRDVVSGDFYWLHALDNRTILVAADCTGHGVPGAFMSMLGVSSLNEIVSRRRRLTAAQILNELRTLIKETLSQSEEGGPKDGMDMAICIIDNRNKSLQYSGAHNPLYLVRDGELIEYKADTMPIGTFIGKEAPFRNKNINLQEGDCFYLFSDGFQDQFGGEEGKKFLSKNLKRLLVEVHDHPMPRQQELIHDTLKQWMQGFEQVDDIILVGVKI